MLSFMEWTLLNRPKGLRGKKDRPTSFASKNTPLDTARTVTRVDHGPDLQKPSEYITNAPERRNNNPRDVVSGKFHDRVVQPHVTGMSKIKGVFAGNSEKDVANYAVPRDSSHIVGSKGQIYMNKDDASNLKNNMVSVNTYNRSRFRQMGSSGEWISSNPGKPLRSKHMTAADLLKRSGKRVKTVRDVRALADRARRRGINFSGENIDEATIAETPQLDTEIDRDWGQEYISDAETHYKRNKKEWRTIHSTPTHDIVMTNRDNYGMYGTYPGGKFDKSAIIAARNKRTGKMDMVSGGPFDTKNKRYREEIAVSRRRNKIKMPQLYSIALHTGAASEVQSDITQSPGAKKSWKRLYAQNDDIEAGVIKTTGNAWNDKTGRRGKLKLADFDRAYQGERAIFTRLTAKLRKKKK